MAADVTRAQARLQSAAARVSQADRALRTAIITFNGNFEGLQQTTRFGDVLVLVNRPQEVVFALQLLKTGLRRVLHDGRRIQPGAVRAVPRAGLPRPRNRVLPAPRQRRAGGHVAACLPAPGGQWAAPGNPLTHGFPPLQSGSGADASGEPVRLIVIETPHPNFAIDSSGTCSSTVTTGAFAAIRRPIARARLQVVTVRCRSQFTAHRCSAWAGDAM